MTQVQPATVKNQSVLLGRFYEYSRVHNQRRSEKDLPGNEIQGLDENETDDGSPKGGQGNPCPG